ncbi:MAG: YnbE family lipoprotein [Pseudomonadota bacterium]
MKSATPALLALGFAAACTPTVKIEAPDKPIRIDLNVKIDQEVRVRLDDDVEDLIADNPNLF